LFRFRSSAAAFALIGTAFHASPLTQAATVHLPTATVTEIAHGPLTEYNDVFRSYSIVDSATINRPGFNAGAVQLDRFTDAWETGDIVRFRVETSPDSLIRISPHPTYATRLQVNAVFDDRSNAGPFEALPASFTIENLVGTAPAIEEVKAWGRSGNMIGFILNSDELQSEFSFTAIEFEFVAPFAGKLADDKAPFFTLTVAAGGIAESLDQVLAEVVSVPEPGVQGLLTVAVAALGRPIRTRRGSARVDQAIR
jgi:hypothetical protein